VSHAKEMRDSKATHIAGASSLTRIRKPFLGNKKSSASAYSIAAAKLEQSKNELKRFFKPNENSFFILPFYPKRKVTLMYLTIGK
jgi:hypothetical protein